MLKENLGNKFHIVSIFKPNAPLASVVEDLGKLGKGLTKQDHIVIVGGPGVNFIAERTSNTNVGGMTSHE
jgi:hypothetical protein